MNKIWRKTIFNMADGILTPCNVARSWDWFRHVTAPCNVACCSGIVTLNSPSGSTLQRDTWHAIEIARWQHPAMWHVALESWHWIRQVAPHCSMAGGSGMTCHWIRPNVRHIRIIYIWFRFRPHHCSRHIILHKSPKFYSNRTTIGRKIWRHVDFQDGGSQPSWILGVQ